jgi:predicted HNH restriction endonuclease
MWTTICEILLAVLSVAALASLWAIRRTLSAYVSGYGQEKGKNLATYEDIDKLVKQVQAVTTATKVIEAKISDEVWTRQRGWELRRDAIFEALKEMATVERSLRLDLVSHDNIGLDRTRNDEIQTQHMCPQKHEEALVAFARAKVLASVACSKQVRDQFDLVEEILDVTAKRAVAGEIAVAWDKQREYWPAVAALLQMVRRDLAVDKNPGATPPSTES